VNGLKGKVALVTGAGGGIGAAVARALADCGVKLALSDINRERVDEVAAELRRSGSEVASDRLDVSSLTDFERVARDAADHFGGIDFLVNVAGGGTPRTLETITPEDWEKVIGLNLTGPFNGIKACAPHIRKRGGGSIVTVAALASVRMSMNNGVSYTSAKAGVLGLTRHAAYELGRDQIRVNAVLPGPVLTGQMKAKISQETLERVPQQLPLGRWVTPEEVAGPVVFFCSDAASACTGTDVIIDCGFHIGAIMSRSQYDADRSGTRAGA
jgi:NAD(P)-dependent dehydrogenase (short-subunit alcohol dehydrogenase family)